MVEDMEYSYIWKEKKLTKHFNLYKGEYFDEEYYIVEEKIEEHEVYIRTMLHFILCTEYEDIQELISELDEIAEELDFFGWDNEMFSMDCVYVTNNSRINGKDEKLLIIFDEYGDNDDLLIAVKAKEPYSYEVYDIDRDLLLDYEQEDLNEILQEEYGVELFPKDTSDKMIENMIALGLIVYWVYHRYN